MLSLYNITNVFLTRMSVMKINKNLKLVFMFIFLQIHSMNASSEHEMTDFPLLAEGFQVLGRDFKAFEADYLKNNSDKYTQALEQNKLIFNQINNFDNLELQNNKLVSPENVNDNQNKLFLDETDVELKNKINLMHNLDFFITTAEQIIIEEMREPFSKAFADAIEQNTPINTISDPIFLYLMHNQDVLFIERAIQSYINDYRYPEDEEDENYYRHDRFLRKVVSDDNLDYFLFLRDLGVDISEKDEDGETLFDLAADCNAVTIASYLLGTKEWDVNELNEDEETPLFFAVESDSIEMILLLLKNGADVNHKDDSGFTPAHQLHSLSAARLLIGAGANMLAKSNDFIDSEDSTIKYDGLTVLNIAITSNTAEIIPLLLQAGADLNERDSAEDSLLHKAVRNDANNVIPLLLQAGLDINQQNNSGDSPLKLAVMSAGYGNIESLATVKQLLDAGADMNVPINYYESQALENLFSQARLDRDRRAKLLAFMLQNKDVTSPQGYEFIKKNG